MAASAEKRLGEIVSHSLFHRVCLPLTTDKTAVQLVTDCVGVLVIDYVCLTLRDVPVAILDDRSRPPPAPCDTASDGPVRSLLHLKANVEKSVVEPTCNLVGVIEDIQLIDGPNSVCLGPVIRACVRRREL